MSFSTVAVEPTATGSCWIDTDGKFFPVEYTYHDVFAREMCELRNIQQTGWPVGALEDAGWLHVSNSESKHVSREGIRIEMERRRPSDAQIQTVWDWAIAHSNAGREDWADAIIKWISNYE